MRDDQAEISTVGQDHIILLIAFHHIVDLRLLLIFLYLLHLM